ncbi:hypothetical protein [Bosea vestrisii]|uniref:hypothetical protein n=1 Tax=Bosea vestrisii TaxID=151416 RepID=UPI003267C59D
MLSRLALQDRFGLSSTLIRDALIRLQKKAWLRCSLSMRRSSARSTSRWRGRRSFCVDR